MKAAETWEELHRELAKVGLTIKVQNNGVNIDTDRIGLELTEVTVVDVTDAVADDAADGGDVMLDWLQSLA